MLFKHPFLNLNMGLVKENFVIAKKDDKNFWEARGFKIIRKYPIFRYKPISLLSAYQFFSNGQSRTPVPTRTC